MIVVDLLVTDPVSGKTTSYAKSIRQFRWILRSAQNDKPRTVMKNSIHRLLTLTLTFTLASGLAAGIAENASRQKVAGIDVVALKTGVRDVVTITGGLPAGDARSPDTNSALADLAAGMLDKGTTTHDKFAISQLLGDVGASISFGVGPSTLNINGKCLRKDLPLVISLISEQLRSPAFSAMPACKPEDRRQRTENRIVKRSFMGGRG